MNFGYATTFGVVLAVVIAGCTDAQWSKVTQLGGAQVIRCYSGGQLIYEGESTGKVMNERDSDGYYWEDSKTHRVVEVSADCIFAAK